MKNDVKRYIEKQLKTKKLKFTKQRKIILEVFFSQNAHKSADEILQDVRKIDEGISQSTVYRTLKLLQQNNLAHMHHFHESQARFEPIIENSEHHDHLICTQCGLIVEFFNENIEMEQEKIARQKGFLISHHKMELYGLCLKCRSNKKTK